MGVAVEEGKLDVLVPVLEAPRRVMDRRDEVSD
jgi:hypothetical protein